MDRRKGIENPDVIDFITQAATGEMVLIMLETRPWDGSVERLYELQNKLNTYVSFVTSGELAERVPQARRQSVRIQLDTLERPDASISDRFDDIESKLGDLGIRFAVNQLLDENGGRD
jgi:hypothetical protein